ncbi:MAG: AraC family transcriptional regulator ligand-binding domain-containing protein, partial [Bermanella sp.]
IGMLIGGKVNINAKGVLANWISQCENFAEAFATFTQHISLLNPSECWHIKECKSHVEISFQFNQASDYPFCAVERSLTAFIAWSESLTNKKLELIRVDFAFPKPVHADLYEPIFGDDINYDALKSCFILNKIVLNYPLVTSNRYLKHIMSERAQEILEKLNTKESVTLKVTELFNLDLSTYCQQEKVCDVLHMSRATLYRKLKLENTSFSQLLEMARKKHNKKLKIKGVSVDKISSLLGYQDVSTYYKKFKNS